MIWEEDMNRGSEVRQALMTSTIRVISAQGIQNATTKALSVDSGLSEVYIYRYFKDKEDLFQQTFDSLDKEIMLVMCKSYQNINRNHIDARIGFKNIFHDFWKFCLGNKDRCSFFIQYYYSSYYLKHSEVERKKIYQPLIDLITPSFEHNVDIWVELNHMYDIVFPKLLRVIRGSMPDNVETEENVYKEIALIEEKNIHWIKYNE